MLWAPTLPDCAPLDHGIWAFVKSKACTSPHTSVDALKASDEEQWDAMEED